MPSVYQDNDAEKKGHENSLVSPDQAQDLQDQFDAPSISDEERAYNQPAIGDSERNTSPGYKALHEREMNATRPTAVGGGRKLGTQDGEGPISGGTAGGTDDGGKGKSPTDLLNQEGGGGLFRQEDAGKKKKFSPGSMIEGLKKRKKQVTLAVGILGLISGTTGAVLTMVSPFKALSIPTFLEQKYMAAMTNASDKMGEHLLTDYIRKYVIPSLSGQTGCTSTRVDRHCIAPITGDNPVQRLYSRWRGNKQLGLEHALAIKGYEIKLQNGRYFMSAPGLGNPVDLEDVRTGKVTNIMDMQELSRNGVRAELRKSFQDASKFHQLLMRYRIGNLLKYKYGIVRCIFACDFKDKFHDKVALKKRAFQAFFLRRVVEMRAQTLAVVFQCLMQDCSTKLTSEGAIDETSPDHAAPRDDFDRQSESALRAYAAQFTGDKLADLVKNLEEFKKDGMGKYIFKKIVEKLGTKLIGTEITYEAAEKIAGPAGWVLLASKIMYFLLNSGETLKKMAYVANAATMVQTAYMFLTIANEAKAHHVDPQMLGSVTNTLNGNIDGRATVPIEASPYYDKTFGISAHSPTAALINALMPQKAYAATATTTNKAELCNNGESVQANQDTTVRQGNQVCPELRLKLGTAADQILNGAGNFIKSIPILGDVLVVATNIIHGPIAWINQYIIGPVTQAIGDALIAVATTIIPPLGPLIEKIKEQLAPLAEGIIKFITEFVVPNLLPDNYSAARLLDIMGGGFDAAGNTASHQMLGGALLTQGAMTAVLNDQNQRDQEAFAIEPLSQRLFDTSNQRSFISQVALNMPSNMTGAAQNSFASLLSNPLGKITDSFASMFMPGRVSAAATDPRDDPFDVDQYGYDINDPVFTQDPETTWDQCKDGKINQAYNTEQDDIDDPALKKYGYTIDHENGAGQPVNSTTNPCFLLMETTNYDQQPTPPAGGGSGGGGDSGQAIPIGDLPGWHQVFADDFTIPAALGSWGSDCDGDKIVYTGDHAGQWKSYPKCYLDTYQKRPYRADQVLDVSGGDLNFHLHPVDGQPAGANPSPVLTGGSQYQTYGRYEARFRTSSKDMKEYYTAWLLWPQNEGEWNCAESDFPEGSLADQSVTYFAHNCVNHQDSGSMDVDKTQWHNYIQNWKPGLREYYVDDKLVGSSTTAIYDKPERWQLQTETNGDGASDGYLYVDWVVVYSYTGG